MEYLSKKVVCFGGGTGLPAVLSGLKQNPWLELSAIVNMFDSGGSSGELRDRFGILPPGDVLKCLLALSKHEQGAREILLKRIENKKYSGHTGGNVLLLGFEKVFGNHADAIDALGQLLSIQGKVIPVTHEQSTLCAEYQDGTIYKSETNVDDGIKEGKVLRRLFLEPEVMASKEALESIHSADVICIGPGSFYTSIMSNFLPKKIKKTIAKSKAKIIFISNLLTESVGMKDYCTDKFITIVEKYIGRKVDIVIFNKSLPNKDVLNRYALEHKYPVIIGKNSKSDSRFIFADLWTDSNIARHDSLKLANLISGLISQKNK
ncbi:MAG: YvcK family protein [Candidatus Zambryskibacteria bacterium]|nr:YvcK family protein [Candidatus Zambryskibacteria bacterium]